MEAEPVCDERTVARGGGDEEMVTEKRWRGGAVTVARGGGDEGMVTKKQ